ncbi:MAG: hypothetical protein MMC23_007486 [Stictis urceolatum]|nr:hypothetical protein [Stictis urceolata]
MADAQEDDRALEERLKSALWYATGKAVDEETMRLGINATPQFIGSLSELVWAQIENVAHDLETFANHAGRRTIGVEDVMLLTRRNEGLETLLGQHRDAIAVRFADEKAGKKRKRDSAATTATSAGKAGGKAAEKAAAGTGKAKGRPKKGT